MTIPALKPRTRQAEELIRESISAPIQLDTETHCHFVLDPPRPDFGSAHFLQIGIYETHNLPISVSETFGFRGNGLQPPSESRSILKPAFPGSHPSISRQEDLFATDVITASFGGPAGQSGVAVAKIAGGEYRFLHRFNNAEGAESWRVSHPHPVFSADGNRVYFNVNYQNWTRLFVAEADDPVRLTSH